MRRRHAVTGGILISANGFHPAINPFRRVLVCQVQPPRVVNDGEVLVQRDIRTLEVALLLQPARAIGERVRIAQQQEVGERLAVDGRALVVIALAKRPRGAHAVVVERGDSVVQARNIIVHTGLMVH